MHLIKRANNEYLKGFIDTLKLQNSFEEKIIKEIINDCSTINSIKTKDELDSLIRGLKDLIILLRSKQENVYDAIEGIIRILDEKRNQM